MTPQTPPPSASPIADLSYRNYDGPLCTHRARWWIVALAGLRGTLHNRWFWALAAGACLPYVFHGLVYYMTNAVSPMTGGMGNPMAPVDANGHKYGMVFYSAFSGFEMMWLFGIALLAGAGSIASDHHANALQIYLSKPITKADYLFGKWLSLFFTVSGVSLAPALLLYGFLGATFVKAGFFTHEPSLLPRIIVVCLVPGLVHASLLTGFSSWCSSSRMAGALYSAFYFATSIVTGIVCLVLYGGHPGKGILLQHSSVSGLMTGLAQWIHGITMVIPSMSRHSMSLGHVKVPPPDPWALVPIAVAICLLALAAARWRIKAVEVIRG